MSDNLEVAKECGFEQETVYAGFEHHVPTGILRCNTAMLDNYTSRILASHEAAHDAEIAKLKENTIGIASFREVQAKLDNRLQELSTANERIAYLEVLVALQADALKEARTVLYVELYLPVHPLQEKIGSAISASAETVQAFRDKLTEPLRMEVAMLRSEVYLADSALPRNYMNDSKRRKEVLDNTQATAQSYEQEVEARGAVKALEEVRVVFHTLAMQSKVHANRCGYMDAESRVAAKLTELRATSKKAG